jgi:predicted NUDIX family NTP pyrophosphohydrolase
VARTSAGLLVFRIRADGPEVLLVHPGGPFWASRDEGSWSIPKGEYDPAVDRAIDAARREFSEETGHPVPDGRPVDLGEVVQRSGKVVRVWAVEGDLDADDVVSNPFTMEWPPGSGRTAEFPEVDRAGWFTTAEARRILLAAQTPFLDRLTAALDSPG